MNAMTRSTLFVFAAAVVSSGLSAKAFSHVDAAAIAKLCNAIPASEMAARASRTVAKAAPREKAATAAAILRAVVPRHRAGLLPLVASLAQAAPQAAASTAGTAATLEPDQAIVIAIVASKQAPAVAHRIAAAVARAVPSMAGQVANALIAEYPAAARRIAEAVVSPVPQAAQVIAEANPNLTRRLSLFSGVRSPIIGGSFAIYGATMSGQPAPADNQPPVPAPPPIIGPDLPRGYDSP
jgi:hypothetical protein